MIRLFPSFKQKSSGVVKRSTDNRKESDYRIKFRQIDFSEQVKEYAEAPLTRQLIMDLLKGYKRPNDKISELIKKGQLTPVKRGLYIPGPHIQVERPHPFLLANHLWGPSYISLESALSFWGLILERTYAVSSVTTKATKTYKTDVGTFIYTHSSHPITVLAYEA